MNTVPDNQDDSADRDAERQADAMKAQLRRDVASWSEARGEPSLRSVDQPSAPIARQPPLPLAAKPKKPKPAKSAQPAPVPARVGAKPFTMSYDGGTSAEYIQHMIDRGAR